MLFSRDECHRFDITGETLIRQAHTEFKCICGPIGPTEQLPLVARLVNELELDLRHAHIWAMDEWVINGKQVPADHALSFERADRELCFNRIRPELRMPEKNLHFPKADLTAYLKSWDRGVRCVVM